MLFAFSSAHLLLLPLAAAVLSPPSVASATDSSDTTTTRPWLETWFETLLYDKSDYSPSSSSSSTSLGGHGGHGGHRGGHYSSSSSSSWSSAKPGTSSGDADRPRLGRFPRRINKFKAPEEGSVRGPCPAINTLANHGFINRDGKDINVLDLAAALEDVYNVRGETLIQGPIASAIELGLTDTVDGRKCTVELKEEGGETCFLDLDNLFEAKGGKPDRAQEHDSSFVREDFGQESGVDDQLPSPRLIELLFDSTTREILQPYEIMEYQRQRIQDSCERRQDRADGFEREYTDEHRGGMALQGSLLFVLAQISVDEPAFMKLNKANLRSILEKEKLPWNFNPAANQRFTFVDNVPSDNFRDAFRQNIETAICAFCNESTNECDRELARIGNLHCFSDPDGDGVNTIWPVCSGKEEEEFCDGDGDCDDTDFCNCDVGQSFCSTGVNPCVSTASVGRVGRRGVAME